MDLVILALIAGFILYKLLSTLGQRTGIQSDDLPKEKQDNVINFGLSTEDKISKKQTKSDESENSKQDMDLDPHLRRALVKIRTIEPQFSLSEFSEGASIAFEMVLDAYAESDLEKLKTLLSKELYQTFKDAIDERAQRGEIYENTLVRLEQIQIEKIDLNGTIARIRTEIVSEQIPLTRDKNGEIIDGNPDQIDQIFDYWTFERNLRSKDPNWVLISTEV